MYLQLLYPQQVNLSEPGIDTITFVDWRHVGEN